MGKKELELRSKGMEVEATCQALIAKQLEGNVKSRALPLGDIMPGYESLNTYYDNLGFIKHPISGKPLPPEEVAVAQQALKPKHRLRRSHSNSLVHSDISSLLSASYLGTSSSGSALPELSQLSVQFPPLQRNRSGVS